MSGPEIRKQKGAPCAKPLAQLHVVPPAPSHPDLILPVPMSASSSATARVIMGAE